MIWDEILRLFAYPMRFPLVTRQENPKTIQSNTETM
jgi:hypothetical protein